MQALQGELSPSGRNGLPGTLAVSGNPRPLPAETQLALFRVAQESLSNARKHARASDAQLTLEFGKNGLTLTIADDGNAHAPRHTSLGAAGELHSHRVVRTRETTSLRIAPLAFRRSLSSLDTFRKVN